MIKDVEGYNGERRAVFAKINLLDKPQFIKKILSKLHISGIIYVCFRILKPFHLMRLLVMLNVVCECFASYSLLCGFWQT